MGGNARAVDIETGQPKYYQGRLAQADHQFLKSIQDAKELEHELYHVMSEIDFTFEQVEFQPLWGNVGYFNCVNGSLRHLFFNNDYEKFIKVKAEFGDIDIAIPEEKLLQLWEMLQSYEGQNFGPWKYIGQTKPKLFGSQINSIWLRPNGSFIQLDFEAVEFEQETGPTEFAVFCHSSPWEDLAFGIKGVAHKYLLQVLTWVILHEDVIILTDKSPTVHGQMRFKKLCEPPRAYSFSVDKGLRYRLQPCKNFGNQPLLVNGKQVCKELSTQNSSYITDLEKIRSLLFPEIVQSQFVMFQSYLGLLKLMEFYLNSDVIENVFQQLVEYKLFGKGQALYRNRAMKDMMEKQKMINAFWFQFPLSKPKYELWVSGLLNRYYQNYKVHNDD